MAVEYQDQKESTLFAQISSTTVLFSEGDDASLMP